MEHLVGKAQMSGIADLNALLLPLLLLPLPLLLVVVVMLQGVTTQHMCCRTTVAGSTLTMAKLTS
jgi:hypothetical protein